jgi:hypothetical protein
MEQNSDLFPREKTNEGAKAIFEHTKPDSEQIQQTNAIEAYG